MKLLELNVVVESLELLAVCETKQDVINVEHDVLDTLGRLQSASDVLALDPERNQVFADARMELVSIIQAELIKFKPVKPTREIISHEYVKPVINKKAYKKPKYHNYLEMTEE